MTMARNITDPTQLLTHQSVLADRSNELSIALNARLTERDTVDRAVGRLRALVPRVSSVRESVDGRVKEEDGGVLGLQGTWNVTKGEREEEREGGLVERVGKVYETSERIGGKVARLDGRMNRVREAVGRVGEVMELKGRNALQTMRDSIPQEDWETATRACKRAMDIPSIVTGGVFAARPTPMDPSPPPAQLSALRDSLLATFSSQFRSAAEARDEQGTSRFFRLFPMIGAEEQGLGVYADFVVTLVKTKGAFTGATQETRASSPLFYITNLTTLLESIALIIDQHQPVVEKYYGEGKMRVVVGRLQAEGDRGVKSLVEGWEEERRVGRLISETKQSQFSYLTNPIHYLSTQSAAQNSLSPNLGSSTTLSGTSGVTTSLAALSSSAQQNLAHHLPSAATSLLATYAGTSQKRTPQEEENASAAMASDQGPDPRDVERILGECTALGSRWALYRRFVWERLQPEDEQDASDRGSILQSPPDTALTAKQGGASGNLPTPAASGRAGTDQMLRLLDDSESRRTIENMLKMYYEPLEAWYLRSSIEKAHKMDTPDLSSKPQISSTVDDTFYLLKLVLNRLISTGNLVTFSSMREKISTIIERDYLGVLQKKMDAVYSGAASVGMGFGAGVGSSLAGLTGQGKESERERRERDLRTSYSVLLNDLDVSAQYTDRLIDDLIGSESASQTFLEIELTEVEEQLRDLGDSAGRMRAAAKNGLDQLFNQLTRPGLRSLLEDVYKGISYVLDDDGYAEAEEQDLVRKRFIANWAPLVDGYKDTLTDANYQMFFNMTVDVLLGAIRFDKDVRAVVNYLSGQTNFGGARDKFIRLQQIATILNLDSDEDSEDFYSSSGIAWRLSKPEYDSIVALRM
ncbi:hypothetical protein QFC21_002020 [Naganishia friedmannii]|uniref:Uncharacterized protein n=1 Tax=Naganishia friedmannii TaxID=89922 RepID=A0ACC2VZP0_9TREE|nr:hypothetical protein QFC21_002020 [Naganishia friedmannii]